VVSTVLAFGFGIVVTTVFWWLGVARRRESSRSVEASTESPQASGDGQTSGHLAASLDALPIGVVVVDADGTEVVRNWMAQSGVLRHHRLLLDEALEELFARTRTTGDDSSRVVQLQGPNQRVMSLAVHPLEQGGAIATVADVTERARLDAVRTDFVANLSHELKTPVGALAVLAETLADLVIAPTLDVDDRAAAQRLASKMVVESHRLSESIDELLELSRIELEGVGTRARVKADTIVCEAVSRVRPLAEPVGITVRVRLDDEPPELFGDARQLVSAIGNLLENAVKYSEPSSTVEIGARATEGAVEFWVRDWGIGIPARDLDRIFERFYRVDRARSRDTGGTGLGLSIVRHVASNHGGTVSVVSREGEGSTFVLHLPLITPDHEEPR